MSETQTFCPKASYHAHRCEHCATQGKMVFWVHPETCKGKVQAHTCPECGTVNWRQWLMEPGKLPQVTNAQGGVNYETLLGYILLAVGLAFLAYGAFLYISKKKEKAIE